MIENLDKRYTIDVLSSGFLMNQTTLKAVFKKVSGKTIASYMKDYRMKKAAEILKESDMLLLTLQARSDTSAKASSARSLKNRTESFRAAVVKNKCLPVLNDNRIIEFERTCFEYEKSY
ncbi:AraC family transcriptional regulator [Ligilactobacillus ruminis]|uniref:AraC family transcriptional regulator n=1 Tax=Ligilactobacillus ruminis TaxID=1623 RepID=A0AAQ2XIL9_9LACO|nr:AraC family transcriptional regulator [Ligilactobacillus ruminis]WDC81289.1 AraC family transcriptional regulator [Ligilactobacillus ruminis]